jgi:hypothetical protein
VFQGPVRVDTSKLVRRRTPSVWRKEVKEPEVSVLSLVKDPSGKYQPGWVTYSSRVLDSPEAEIRRAGGKEALV